MMTVPLIVGYWYDINMVSFRYCSSPSGSGENGGMRRLTYGGAIGYIYMSLSGSGNILPLPARGKATKA